MPDNPQWARLLHDARRAVRPYPTQETQESEPHLDKPTPGDDDWVDPRTDAEIDEAYRRANEAPQPEDVPCCNTVGMTYAILLGLIGLVAFCIYMMLH
jgi:hypothetical protein